MDKKTQTSMKDLVEKLGPSIIPLKEGTTLEVEIISKTRNRILVNVNNLCEGIIPEKEFSTEVFDLKAGDKVLAYLLDLENDEGYSVLSLRRADKERIWQNLKEKMDSGENVKVKVLEANRGGLIVQYGNIEGFLPLSQLYQKYVISKNEPNQIIDKLRNMIDKILEVKIINLDKSTNKLIFSEKEVGQKDHKEKMAKLYKVGDKLKGKITAIVPFGLFVDLGEAEGLVHISEISWERVSDINKIHTLGEEVEVEVISLENGKISLSIKRLMPDPWVKAVAKYKVGDEVVGKVIRITPFGAFAELDDQITGLVHISELFVKEKDNKNVRIEEILEIGKEYPFKILEIKSDAHRVSLAKETETPKPAKKSSKKTDKK